MKRIGVILFWCAWPLLWFFMPLTRRVRIVVVHDAKVLMVKNWIGPNAWDLPGGGIKRGESAEMAARRELMEELHMTATEVKLLHDHEIVRRFHGLTMRVTFAKVEVESLEGLQRNWEIIDTKWLPLSEAGDLVPQI